MSAAETLITEHLDTWTSAIKAKSSAGRGGGRKEEFYGISKLRELILELAVRGLLVPQDTSEEPSARLRKRIAVERARLIEAKEIKKHKAQPKISAADTPFDVPVGWEWVRLDDASPMPLVDGDWIETKDQDENGEVRLIQLADVGVNEFKNVSERFINNKTFERLKCTELLPDDVLIARLPSPIGRACVYPGLLGRAITVVDVAIHRPLGFVYNRYLAHCLNSMTSRTQVESHGKGATRFRIATGNLKTLLIPLPPLAEQHRIVEKVDELMALCDRLEQQQEDSVRTHATLVQTLLGALTAASERGKFEQAWQRVASHFDTLFTTESSIDQLKQTILQLAVMGKLVEHDPQDEPATKLIQIVERDRAAAIKAKQMRKLKAIGPYEGDLPFELPSTWAWSQLGDLVAPEDNAICDGPFGSKLKTEHYIDEKGFAVIRLGNIGNGSFIWGKEGYITQAHFESLTGNHTKPGDLIVAGMAEPLVRCCEVPPELGPAINKADCFRVRLHRKLDRTYVRHFFNSPVAKLLAGEENHGITRQRINLGNAKALPVPIPPLREQKRIVARVDELMALCDRIKASIQIAQITQLHLADTLAEAASH